MSPEIEQALRRASLLYLTTYSRTGASGTVPVLFFQYQEALYFCSQRQTLKIRRIQQTRRVTLHIGQPAGLRLACTACLLEHAPELHALLLRTYRRRYPWRWLFLGARWRRGLAQGTEVMVRLTPQAIC